MRLTFLVPVVSAVALLGACSDDADDTATTATSATSERSGTTATSPTDTTDPTTGGGAALGTRLEVGDQLTERYCEVLTVTVADEGVRAEVWGTQGLNDCPQEGFDAIDPVVAAQQVGADVAVVNGPRFWLLDAIVPNEMAGTGTTQVFGGVEMRSIAFVQLGEGVPAQAPYLDISVERDTEFLFGAGTEVHELTGPDGSIYVMQSYSVEVDPTLTTDELASLGERLELPEGWTYASRVLDEELVVEDIDGIATVVQDELRNTYQLRQRA